MKSSFRFLLVSLLFGAEARRPGVPEVASAEFEYRVAPERLQ
jgi:hypothetical protein